MPVNDAEAETDSGISRKNGLEPYMRTGGVRGEFLPPPWGREIPPRAGRRPAGENFT